MEPLAIVASCATLLSAVGRCTHTVVVFLYEVHDAPSDLNRIKIELTSLDTVLHNLRDNIAKPSNSVLPHNLRSNVGLLLKSCEGVIEEIEECLRRHNSSRLGRGGKWTFGGGKEDMAKFRSSLETHKASLDIALSMITLAVTREIKKDTSEIHRYVAGLPAVRNDTIQILEILEELRRFRARLPPDSRDGGPNLVLQRFLDESTSYAETVVNEESMSDWGDPASPVQRTAENQEYQYPDTLQELAFYPPERNVTPVRTPPRPGVSPRGNLSPMDDRTPSPLSCRSRQYPVNHSDASSELSRLSLGVEKDFEKPRNSPASSRVMSPTRPVSRSVSNRSGQNREASGHAGLGPTRPKEFLDHLRRPDDWHFFTLNHKTQAGNHALSSSELWTHRYTAMTRAPSFLAKVNFKLRQQLDPPRETMLLICVHYPGSFGHDEFDARFATTLESITEALGHTNEACGSSVDTPWWTNIVVLLINNGSVPQTQKVFMKDGMRLRCDIESEHCGIVPDQVGDEDRKIFAHLWEHTTLRTKISWGRKGEPEKIENAGTPLQLIQCQYTSKAGSPADMGGPAHLLPFIRMLDARSCLSVAAGDKIEKFDVFESYMTTRDKLTSIKIADPMQHYPGLPFESSFKGRYGGVPTKIYSPERASKFKQEKRSLKTRVGAFFG